MEITDLGELCMRCAECCRNHPYIELSTNEVYSLEQATGLHFDEFTNASGKAVVKGYFLRSKENGDCFFLEADNDRYSCNVYEVRPRICREYPSDPIQIGFCDSKRSK